MRAHQSQPHLHVVGRRPSGQPRTYRRQPPAQPAAARRKPYCVAGTNDESKGRVPGLLEMKEA